MNLSVCTVSVTTVQAERSFSNLHVTKSCLRNRMPSQRLSNHAILSNEQPRTNCLNNVDMFVDKFAAQQQEDYIVLKETGC